jgi:hypothetical protein
MLTERASGQGLASESTTEAPQREGDDGEVSMGAARLPAVG